MKKFVKAITALEIDTADLTGAFEPFAAGGLPEACFIIRCVNNSNVDVFLTFDGTNVCEFIPSETAIQRQFVAHRNARLAKGTKVGLIGGAGVGIVYLIGYYQK